MKILSYLGRGIMHEYRDLPCQDALGCRQADNGNVIAVLSDGAGSARYAAEAAQATVEAVLDHFSAVPLTAEEPLETLRASVLRTCRERLMDLWEQLGEPDIRHLSATLLFAVSSRERMLLGHLGDGMLTVLDRSGAILLDSPPEHRDGQANATYFVISPWGRQHLRLYSLDLSASPVDFLVMTSDGSWDMFKNRGSGDPVATVREFQQYVNEMDIASNADLADVLNQMAEVAVERMDDWSVLMWSTSAEGTVADAPPTVVSMLREEEEKHRQRCSEKQEEQDE